MSGPLPDHPALWRVSVVVPTYHRPRLLQRCLRALAAQDYPSERYEIIVADDGAEPEVLRVVQNLQRELGGCPILRYLPVVATQGPAAARNAGWRAAYGEVIAFTDDDTIPSPRWLSEGTAALGPERVAVAGQVRVPLGERPTDYELDTAGLENAEFVTANCFVRRNALVAIGGFDERFTAAWREDSDLQFRLLELYGETAVTRAPRAVVEHPVRPGRWCESLWQQRKSMFDALLYKKHPDLYRRRLQARPLWDYYASVLALLAALACGLAGLGLPAAAALAVWLALTLRFCLLRLRHTRHDARHVLEMLLTSAVIPPLSLYWRLVGALRWRVGFL